jgi:hypothetical protein
VFISDSCHVCGGNDDTTDCDGNCFGTAYYDTCHTCSGGLTMRVPNDQCDSSEQSSDNYLDSIFLKELLLLLVSIFALMFAFACCLCVSRRSLLVNRRRDFNLAMRVRERRRGLNADELAQIGVFKVNVVDSSVIGNTECSICLDEFVKNDDCRRLPAPCEHTFHVRCIDEWLSLQAFCPICKRPVRDLFAVNPSSDSSALSVDTEGAVEMVLVHGVVLGVSRYSPIPIAGGRSVSPADITTSVAPARSLNGVML